MEESITSHHICCIDYNITNINHGSAHIKLKATKLLFIDVCSKLHSDILMPAYISL